MPSQELPSQELPSQLWPSHEFPSHEFAFQATVSDELPAHELPAHELPFQVPPFQLFPAASRAAMAGATNAWPKMSCSPCNGASFNTRWAVPREASSVPTPVESRKGWRDWRDVGTGADNTVSRRMASWPCLGPNPALFLRLFACPLSRALAWSGVIDGCCWNISASAPETTAAAWELPLPRKNRALITPPG